MKKLRETIEKNPKRFRKILIFALVAICLSAFVFLPDVAYADGWLQETELYAKDISQLIKSLSHVVYVFIWPCLAIAGAALDNSLIYGSFLHLDAALRNIWNIMKNFANFALGFIFVFTIIKNLFKGAFDSKSPIENAKDTVAQTLLAWVLVQISWFLIAAMIDLSTILIYAVWGIPLSMISSYNENVAKTPILKLNAEFDSDSMSYYYSYNWVNYSPCFLVNKQWWDNNDNTPLQWALQWEYIGWREFLYMWNGEEFKSGYCAMYGYLYKYEESTWFFCWTEGGQQCYHNDWWTIWQQNTSYLNQLKLYWSNLDTGSVDEKIRSCSLVSAYNKNMVPIQGGTGCEEICEDYGEIPIAWDVFSGSAWFTLQNLLENSKWWVWPFITMYSSILNYQDLLINSEHQSVTGNLFGLIINTFFAFILFVPIAILAVLLILRILYLWVVVAISPILVLIRFGPLKGKIKLDEFFKQADFTVKWVMTQIFSPVIVVFAVSLCIILLSTVYKSKPNYDDEATTLSAFGIEKVYDSTWSQNVVLCSNASWDQVTGTNNNITSETYSILWLVNVKINAQNYNHGKSMFARVLLEILATGIVRFFLKFAISMMWKRWKDLMSKAEKLITEYPIIPLPTWGKIGLGTLGIGEGHAGHLSGMMTKKIDDITWLTSQQKALSKYFNGETGDSNMTNVVDYVKLNPGATYESLWVDQKRALENAFWTTGAKTKYGELQQYIKEHPNASSENIATIFGTWIIEAGASLPSAVTNADAIKFNRAQLDAAVKTDENWRKWAEWMVAWSVQLSDWVYIVDYINGVTPADVSSAQYDIVDRETYEKRHFGAPIQNVSAEKYREDKTNIDAYFAQLQKELDKLKELEEIAESERTTEDSQVLRALGNLWITQDELDEIKKNLWITS